MLVVRYSKKISQTWTGSVTSAAELWDVIESLELVSYCIIQAQSLSDTRRYRKVVRCDRDHIHLQGLSKVIFFIMYIM